MAVKASLLMLAFLLLAAGICESFDTCEVRKKDVLTCNRGFGSCRSVCFDDNYPCANTQCNGYRCDYVSRLYQACYCQYRC